MIKNLLAPVILLMVLFQCQQKPSFTKIEITGDERSSASFNEYCKSFEESLRDADHIYNRFSEVKKVIAYNEKYRVKSLIEVNNTIDEGKILILEQELQNPEITSEEKQLIELFLATAKGENNADKVFENAELINALKYIIEQAENFHFLLLNEAHYSSQQRAFTTILLHDLWEKGYRYLALEALASGEFDLNKRGYPTSKSGYYIQDPIFGNLVREAISLGYILVPYEITEEEYMSDRERIQAKNIYERTFKKDEKGKVVVHAGFSHISKQNRGTRSLMGYYLNEYVKGEVLSVDQQTMSYVGEKLNNDYYDFIMANFNIKKPSLFLEDKEVVVVPMEGVGFDILIYHPKIEFIKNRPMWLYSSNKTSIALTAEMKEYASMLIRAQYVNEDENSVPVDQFVIDDEKELILPRGDFVITIVNCEDKIVSKYSLSL